MIVADTNLVAYLLIEGSHTDTARRVWQLDPDWRLPSLWRSEFLNVLATSFRASVLTRRQAEDAWERALAVFSLSEHEPSGGDVLDFALRLGISAYDAHFVALAAQLSALLVTFDRKLAEAAPDLARAAGEFVAA